MKIKVLGTRGEIEPSDDKHRNHSGILIDDQILFDLGEEMFLRHNPAAVFITHLHPDHAYFVMDDFTIPETRIYSPEKFKTEKNINILQSKVEINGYSITPIPTIHSKLVKSQAYLIEKTGQRILYTGDMIWIEKKYWPMLQKLDLVITEASYINSGGLVRQDENGKIYGHNGIPDLIKFFTPFTSKILFVHFGSWFFRKADSEKRIKDHGKKNLIVFVGYDGMRLKI